MQRLLWLYNSDSWSTGSVAVLTSVHVHAWLCRCCYGSNLSSTLSLGVPQVFSLLLVRLDPRFYDKPPTVAVCSCTLPACWGDVACLQISFANVCVSKDRPSHKYGASSKLCIQHVLGNSTIFHAAYIIKLARASLGERGKPTGYSCLCQSVLVWDTIISVDAIWSVWDNTGGRHSVCALDGSTRSMFRCHRAVCWARRLDIPSSWCWWSVWSFSRPFCPDGPLPLLPCRSLSSA